jgi:hypothetical protein
MPTEASAVEWNATMSWNDAVTLTTTQSTHITESTTIYLTTDSKGEIYVDSGTINVTGNVQLPSANKLTIYLKPGVQLIWGATVTVDGSATNDIVTINQNSGTAGTTVQISGCSISGTSSGTMLKIANSFEQISISGTTISNSSTSSGSKALYLGGGAALSGVNISSGGGYGIQLYSGNLTITGSGNQISGYDSAVYSTSTGAMSIENATVTYTGNYSSTYAIEHPGSLSLNNVNVSSAKGKGINHNTSSGSISISGGSITSAETPLYTGGDGTVTNTTFTKTNGSSSYAIEATGNLTLDGSSTSVTSTYNHAIGYNAAAGKTLQIKNGMYSALYNVIDHSGGNISISGGTFNSNSDDPYNSAIVKSYGGNSGNTLTISGGTLNGGLNNGIYIGSNSYMNTTMTGGSVKGSTGIYIYSYSNTTTTQISGGTVEGTGTTGYGIHCQKGTLEITGGTFDGVTYGVYSDNITTTITPAAGKTVAVKGKTAAVNGTFDYDITPFAAISYDYDYAPTYGYFAPLSFNEEQYIIFYNEIPTFTITVNGGQVNGDGSYGTYPYGEGLTITLNEIPGKIFSHWEVEGYPGFEQPTEPNFQMLMPLNNVIFTAIFEQLPAGAAGTPVNTLPPEIIYQPITPIDYGDNDETELDYLEKHASKQYITYLWRDFSVTPAITEAGKIHVRTARDALGSAVRRARSQRVSEIKLNIPEGTVISDLLLRDIVQLQQGYDVEIVINYFDIEE